MGIKNKNGQSTVEYVLLVTAVVAVMIAFSTNSNRGGLQEQLCSSLNSVANDINTLSGKLTDSHENLPQFTSSGENAYRVPVTPGVTEGVTTGTGG